MTNRRSFTDLSDLRGEWELLVGGEVLDSGVLDGIEVPAGSSVALPLPCAVPDRADAHLTVRWYTRRATPWAPRRHLTAWDQLTLHPPISPKLAPIVPPGATNGAFFGVCGEVEACVFRAAVDNDGFKLMPELRQRSGDGSGTLERWIDAGVDRRPATAFVEHEHRIETDDTAEVHHHVITVPDDHPDLARVGVTFQVAAGIDRLRWYGRGPLENYPDRNRGAVLGVWDAAVDEAPYLVPQDFGLRTDCRWFEFVDDQGVARLRLDVLDPVSLHVSATRFTDRDLYDASHETDLRPRREVTVHVDVAHRGLGTASCGPDVLDRYRIEPGEYRFSYRLSVPAPRRAARRVRRRR